MMSNKSETARKLVGLPTLQRLTPKNRKFPFSAFGVTPFVGTYPFTVEGRNADGTLPLDVLGEDLEVSIPLHDAPVSAADRLQLTLDGRLVGTKVALVPTVDPTVLTLDKSLLTNEGTYVLDYTLFRGFGQNAQPANERQNLIVDRSPPGSDELGALRFAGKFLNGVTEGDLEGTAKNLIATVPDWLHEDEGDFAFPFIALGDPDGSEPPETDFVEYPAHKAEVTIVGDHLEIQIPLTTLVAVGDGYQWFTYQLEDKLGNRRAVFAPPVRLNVLLVAAPTGLLEVEVPAADVDGVINWDDATATNGVQVNIPLYTTPDPEDMILLYWDGRPSGTVPVGPEPGSGWSDPLFGLGVSYDVVNRNPTASVVVRFTVIRNGIESTPSPDHSVDVYLSTPGDIVDPDPTTPAHENLIVPLVKSDSGQSNIIPPADYGKNASITVPRSGANNNAIWADGDTLTVNWAGDTTVGRPIINTDTTDITLTIPHTTVIEPGPAGPVNVYYTISRPLPVGTGQFGVARSPTVSVDVQNTAELPGGGAALPLALYPEAIDDGSNFVIDQILGGDGTTVRIHVDFANDNMEVDDFIDFRFVGVYDFYDMDAPEVPNTEVTNNYQLRPEDIAAGYRDFTLTGDQLRSICETGAYTQYTLRNTAGAVRSPKAPLIVSMFTDGYCVVPTPGP